MYWKYVGYWVVGTVAWIHIGACCFWITRAGAYERNGPSGSEICTTNYYYLPGIFIPCFLSQPRGK